MKCLCLVVLSIGIAGVLQSNGDNSSLLPPPDKPLSSSKSQILMKRTGGFISRRYPGASFVFADARSDSKLDENVIREIQEGCQIPVERRMTPLNGKQPIQIASELLANPSSIGGVVVLYDGSAGQPVLTVFPENRITLLNVTPLGAGATPETFMTRLVKEMWRAISFTAGGTTSNTPFCVMQPVLSPSDLDKIKCVMASPDVTGQIYNHARKFGFGVIETSTYRAACKAGWAPPPTNEYQKVIWDRVKADKERGPTNPITIPPPNAKK